MASEFEADRPFLMDLGVGNLLVVAEIDENRGCLGWGRGSGGCKCRGGSGGVVVEEETRAMESAQLSSFKISWITLSSLSRLDSGF